MLKEKVIAVMSIIFFDYLPSAQKLCRITSIVVDEKKRGSGVGSKLINHAKSVALSKKCNILEVTTSLQRQQTHEYYESIGFKKTSYKDQIMAVLIIALVFLMLISLVSCRITNIFVV